MTDTSANVIVQAVDDIGAGAAASVEQTALSIEAEAKEIGDKLRLFAAKIREQTSACNSEVSLFRNKMLDVFQSNDNLQKRLEMTGECTTLDETQHLTAIPGTTRRSKSPFTSSPPSPKTSQIAMSPEGFF